VVLVLLDVARPFLFRPRLIVLNFTVASTGTFLMAVTFRGAAALGIGGMRSGEVEGFGARQRDVYCNSRSSFSHARTW